MSNPLAPPRVLDAAEVHDLLARHSWGVLAMNGPDGPYAVPVAYGLRDGVFYLGSGAGRKLDFLRADPRVCLTITEVRDGDHWRAVLVRGALEWLDAPAERTAAAEAMVAQRGAAPLSERDHQRLERARFARLRPAEVSGRARG